MGRGSKGLQGRVRGAVIGAELRLLQGRRRLELFGENHNIRPGWVTVGNSLVGSNFSAQVSFCSETLCSWRLQSM